MNRSTPAWVSPQARARRAAIASFAFVLFFSAGGCNRSKVTLSEPRDASVVFITLDTTRADHLSCYAEDSAAPADARREGESVGERSALPREPRGFPYPPVIGRRHRGAKTPQLDALAARGVRFTRAIAPVPLTLPSHATMFTGTYPEIHGLRDMGGFTLDPKHVTLASMARRAGYTTAAFVGSKAVGRVFGLHQGFDTYDDQMPTRGQQEEGKLPGVFPERRAAVTTDRALEWLQQHGRERFFLWVHYYDPHEPYEPLEPFKSQYRGDPYAGEIAYTDAQAGRIFDYLQKQNLRDRTLVIVVGDHGEGLNDHGEGTHGIFVYDDTMHVPLIVAGPGVPEGRVVRHQTRVIDLLPTVTEFLRLAPHPAAQGVSLWPLIERGQPLAGQGTNYAYIETLYPKTYMNWSELRGMRTDRWKFILAPKPELYDLEKDPAEKENVVARHPAEADQLQKRIWEVIGPAAKDQKLAYAPVSKETRQELESLGYVSAGTPREIVLNMSGPDPKDRVSTLQAMQRYDRAMKSKAYAQAARAMDVAVKNDSANPLARLYLANAYEKMRDWRRAIETYRGAVEIHVATDEILSRLGKAYLRAGDREHAVEAMETAGRMNPTDLDNFRNLGTAYLELRRLPNAEKAFRAILLQDDRYAAAYNGLGLIAIERGDGDAARANFEKALEFDPEQYEAMLNLGVLFQRAGVRDQAIRYLKMFAERAPRENYGHLLPQVREAIEELRAGR